MSAPDSDDRREIKMAEKINNLKRPFENVQEALFLDVLTGNKFYIKDGQDFVIGRVKNCSLRIKDIYVSRVQCVIKYENNNFVLYDYSISSGTFFNCQRIHKNDSRVLQHGDIVAFGNTKQIKFVYKFVLVTNPGKKFKSEEYKEALEKLFEKNKLLKSDVTKLGFTIKKLSKDYQHLKENIQTKMCELKKKITDIITRSEAHFNSMEEQKHYVDLLKSQIHGQLEDNFQCPICNEILLKSTIGNCNHSFCENCISTWLSKSKLCPVCRTPINSTKHILAVDNFISEVIELLGGSIKEQRDALLIERKVKTLIRVKARINKRQIVPTLQGRPQNTIGLTSRAVNRRSVEIVDLT